MKIDEIREGIADSMSTDRHDTWANVLSDTDPGNYGTEDVEFAIDRQDIWVDVPNRTFTFKNGELSFSARLGASSDRDGVDLDFRRTLSGQGKFEFPNANKVIVTDIRVNEPIELFEGMEA